MSDPRHWECSVCGKRTSSSTAVRARYCAKCGQWCERTDDGEGNLGGGLPLSVWYGPGESVRAIEDAIRQGGRPVVQA